MIAFDRVPKMRICPQRLFSQQNWERLTDILYEHETYSY